MGELDEFYSYYTHHQRQADGMTLPGAALVPLAVVMTWVLLFKSLYDEGASFTSVASVALNLACLAIFAGVIIPAREGLLALAPTDYPAIRETAQLLAFATLPSSRSRSSPSSSRSKPPLLSLPTSPSLPEHDSLVTMTTSDYM